MKLADLNIKSSDTLPPGTIIMCLPLPVKIDVQDGVMTATVMVADTAQSAVVIKNLAPRETSCEHETAPT